MKVSKLGYREGLIPAIIMNIKLNNKTVNLISEMESLENLDSISDLTKSNIPFKIMLPSRNKV